MLSIARLSLRVARSVVRELRNAVIAVRLSQVFRHHRASGSIRYTIIVSNRTNAYM